MTLERSTFIRAFLIAKHPFSWEERLNRPLSEDVEQAWKMHQATPLQLPLPLEAPNAQNARL